MGEPADNVEREHQASAPWGQTETLTISLSPEHRARRETSDHPSGRPLRIFRIKRVSEPRPTRTWPLVARLAPPPSDHLAGGSGFPVFPADDVEGMWAAAKRKRGIGFVSFLIACAVTLSAGPTPARAHDIYSGVVEDGINCCGGDEQTGDCEALDETQIEVGPTRTRIYSKRYGRWVVLANAKVKWRPLETDPHARPGHWCGKPRDRMGGPEIVPPTADNPDPRTHTYCAWIIPNGF